MVKRGLWIIAIFPLLVGPACRPRAVQKKPDLAAPPVKVKPLKEHFTDEQDFAFVLPRMAPVQGVGGIRASQCATCHVEIYKEWQQSTHAWALRDLQYQAELFKPSSPRWLCLNCHIPLQDQRIEVVRGLKGGDVLRPDTATNPSFDPELQQEAITCATCHVRPGKGKMAGASVIVGPRGNPQAPHPVRADPEALNKICYRCHDPKGERLTPQLVCWFETRKELEQGPLGEDVACSDCHMPSRKRRLAGPLFERFPERDSPGHTWVGGGVPKSFAGYDGLLKNGYEPGVSFTVGEPKRGGGGQVSLPVVVENGNGGHWVPTGDPERFILVVVRLYDAKGRALAKKIHRIGQTWRWEPKAEKIADNRLKPEEERTLPTNLKAPAGASPPARLSVTAYHVRLTSATARHMMKTGVKENWVRGLGKMLRNMPRHYPMATSLHHEEINLETGARKKLNQEELLKRSKAEQHRRLSQRDY